MEIMAGRYLICEPLAPQTPASVTPVADAPVAPPGGAAGL
jgi:hypothetical protein